MTQHNAQSTSEPTISENDLIAQRHAKLKQIQEQAQAKGTSPWPNTFKRENYAEDLQAQFAEVSRERDSLLDCCKGYEINVPKLNAKIKELETKLLSQNPLKDYSAKDLLSELFDRIFHRR